MTPSSLPRRPRARSTDPVTSQPLASRPVPVIVLAAREGTRMRSATPKVLHEVLDRSLLGHVVAAATGLHPDNLVVVVGHCRDVVTEHLAAIAPQAQSALQAEQRGTGHAVLLALENV